MNSPPWTGPRVAPGSASDWPPPSVDAEKDNLGPAPNSMVPARAVQYLIPQIPRCNPAAAVPEADRPTGHHPSDQHRRERERGYWEDDLVPRPIRASPRPQATGQACDIHHHRLGNEFIMPGERAKTDRAHVAAVPSPTPQPDTDSRDGLLTTLAPRRRSPSTMSPCRTDRGRQVRPGPCRVVGVFLEESTPRPTRPPDAYAGARRGGPAAHHTALLAAHLKATHHLLPHVGG